MANLEHVEDQPKHVNMSGEISTADSTVKPAGVSSGRPDGFAVSCAIPSFSAASELMSAPYSCLVMMSRRRHICLPPMYLYKKRTGIQEELKAELLRFSQSLEGVPLAYDDIRIVGPNGNIYDDSGYIHMDIEANFVVFQPKKGEKLLGKVNKLGVGHVGCLVHGCFNASIPKPNLVPMETWRDAGPRVGSDLEFEVMSLDADIVGVLLIRGRLDRTKVQELLAMGESIESGVPAVQPVPEPEAEPETEQNTQLEPKVETPSGDTPTKKKKKNKDKIKEEETEKEVMCTPTPELNGSAGDMNGDGAAEKKKKKKKKKDSVLKEEEEEVALTRMEVHCSDSSGYLSDKPSKKRKHEAGTDVTTTLSQEPETPKSKKKRKSNVE